MLTVLALTLAAGPPPPPPPPLVQEGATVQDATTPADRLRALEREFEDAMQAFYKAYSEASEEKRQALFDELYPDPEEFVPRFRALADEVPGTDTAAGALVWIATRSQNDETSGDALAILVHDHIESPRIKEVCRLLEDRYDDGEELLTKILEASPHRETQGMACFGIAKNLMAQAAMARNLQDSGSRTAYAQWLGKKTADRLATADPAALQARAEKTFERVIAEFADVNTGYAKLGAQAEASLFEIRHLQIGMTAPDIEGEDIDGVAFKLSDYRGKVIVLDFWGNW